MIGTNNASMCTDCPNSGGCFHGCQKLYGTRPVIPGMGTPAQHMVGSVGWLCPRCDRVNAPHSFHCDCSPRFGVAVSNTIAA